MLLFTGIMVVIMAGKLLHRLRNSDCLEIEQKRKIELEKITQAGDDFEARDGSYDNSDTIHI